MRSRPAQHPVEFNFNALNSDYDLIKTTLLQVLNAHMDSLQWIDSSALAVERKLGEVTRFCFTITIIGVLI